VTNGAPSFLTKRMFRGGEGHWSERRSLFGDPRYLGIIRSGSCARSRTSCLRAELENERCHIPAAFLSRHGRIVIGRMRMRMSLRRRISSAMRQCLWCRANIRGAHHGRTASSITVYPKDQDGLYMHRDDANEAIDKIYIYIYS